MLFVSFGTAIERRTSDHGTAAWLRILVVALLIALTVPALAMADDAGTAVADPPASQATPTTDPAPESTPTEPAAQTPADPAPSAEPVPSAEPTPPAGESTPAEPPAATEPPPAPPVVTLPVVDIPVELPGLPEIGLPAPPASSGDPVAAPVPSPGAAPELPEIIPGTGTIPVAVELPPLVTPAEPPAAHLISATTVAPTPPTPPAPGVADALGIPNSPPAVTIGPPQTPGFAALMADLRAAGPAAAAGTDTSGVRPSDLFGPGPHSVGLAGSVTGGASGATQGVIDLATRGEEPSFGFAAEMVVPVGPAPAGSSLLAVLAGYVLPGSSGPPASTLVMLIVIGLILGVGYAARPQLTEALASQRLLGSSSGHGMAVRRPG